MPAPHLLHLDDWTETTLHAFLDAAVRFRTEPTAGPTTRPTPGHVALAFFESSTRTRVSFELAAHRLHCRVVTLHEVGSSMAKGESIEDTIRSIDAMGFDALVVRVASDDLLERLTPEWSTPVICAGAGRRSHPTQGLLDALTVRDAFPRHEPLTITMVGDVAHSRVARSSARAFRLLGANLRVSGPQGLVDASIARALNADYVPDLDDAVADAHVIYALRAQRERHSPDAEWGPTDLWCVTPAHLERAHPNVRLMHPGPVRWGEDVAAALRDDPRSLIDTQVANGVWVRMAVLDRVFAKNTT